MRIHPQGYQKRGYKKGYIMIFHGFPGLNTKINNYVNLILPSQYAPNC